MGAFSDRLSRQWGLSLRDAEMNASANLGAWHLFARCSRAFDRFVARLHMPDAWITFE